MLKTIFFKKGSAVNQCIVIILTPINALSSNLLSFGYFKLNIIVTIMIDNQRYWYSVYIPWNLVASQTLK